LCCQLSCATTLEQLRNFWRSTIPSEAVPTCQTGVRRAACGGGAALLAGALALLAIAVPALTTLPLRLIFNATASVPIGFYRVDSPARLQAGDLVVVAPASGLATFLDQRGYLPLGVPLLKRIAATSGQTVCREQLTISIDGRAIAAARERDHQGRALPGWAGCRRLSENEFFLLNASIPDSIDGRYFGPTAIDHILGVARPLWTSD